MIIRFWQIFIIKIAYLDIEAIAFLEYWHACAERGKRNRYLDSSNFIYC